MGGSEEEAGSSRQKKMDESEGMCRADANYDSCWGRICNPNRGHVLKDILRGLLVLIVLAIVITVIFLLCYFLLNDIEKKEDEVIDNLVKEFSAGGPDPPNPIPEISTNDINENSPNDSEIYDSGPLRGDLGKEKGNLLNEQSNKIELRDPENKFPAEVHANAEEVPEEKNIFKEEPLPEDTQGFIPVQNSPQGNTEGLLEFNFNQDQDGQVLDNFSDFVVAESGADCVPLRLPLCSSSMPWSLTAFPNWVNNNNMNELQDSLKYFQSTIIGGRCSVRATEYSCAILEPACGPDGIPLPPCKAFCEDISRSCSEYLTSDSKHRIALQCDRFPDSKNPNVCVDINRTPSVTTDSKMTDANSNLPHGTTINRQDITQPQFNDFSNIARNPSDDDYPTDTYDEVSGREDPLSPPLLDTVSTDEAKIVELADLQKDVKKLPLSSQFTPEPVQPIIGDSVPQQEFDNIPEEVGSSDGGTTELPVFICDHTKFLCEDGSDCLSQESVCDGIQHCLDNSDEGNCTAPDCKDDSFSCATTRYCIPTSWLCDGADDCKDNSDELNCPINSTTDHDDFADKRDDDNLLAEASDILPGLFGVIDEEKGHGGGSLNTLKNGGSAESMLPKDMAISSRLPLPYDALSNPEERTASEILSQFPKFGKEPEPNFGFENVDDVLTSSFPREENTEEIAINPSEIRLEEEAVGEGQEGTPDRFKISRPNTRFSIERQESFEIRNPSQLDRTLDVLQPQTKENEEEEPVEDYITESSKEAESDVPARRRHRPGGPRIPIRRPNQGTRRPVNSPDEAVIPTDELQSEPVIPVRQRKRPTAPSYESFRTRSTPAPVSTPGKRPSSIVMRRPTGANVPVPSLAEKVEDFLKESEPTDSQSLPSAAQPITIPKQILPQRPEGGNPVFGPNSPRRTRIRPSRPERPFVPGGQLNNERVLRRPVELEEPADLAIEGSDTIEEYTYPDADPSNTNIPDTEVDDTYVDDQNSPAVDRDYYEQAETEHGNYFKTPNNPTPEEAAPSRDEYAYGHFSIKSTPETSFPLGNYAPEPATYESIHSNEQAYAAAPNVQQYNYQISNNPHFPHQRNNFQSPYDNSPQNYNRKLEQQYQQSPPSEDLEEAGSDDSPYYNIRNDQPRQIYQEVPSYSQQTYQSRDGNIPVFEYADPLSQPVRYRIAPNYRQAYPH